MNLDSKKAIREMKDFYEIIAIALYELKNSSPKTFGKLGNDALRKWRREATLFKEVVESMGVLLVHKNQVQDLLEARGIRIVRRTDYCPKCQKELK